MTAAALVAGGCAADAVSGSGGAATAAAPQAEGSFSAKIDGTDYTVDYTGMTAKVEMAHRLNEGGIACVGNVKVIVAGENEQCKLVLDFKPDFSGAMALQNAEFHAKVAIYQDDFPIDSYECPGWADESKFAKGHTPVVYKMSGGEGSLAVKPLAQPEAGQADAQMANYKVDPKGSITMKYQGRSFKLDLGEIKVIGTVSSKGSKNVSCAQQYLPLPEINLKDINPKSPTFGEEVDVSTAFQGKFTVVHMGAGW